MKRRIDPVIVVTSALLIAHLAGRTPTTGHSSAATSLAPASRTPHCPTIWKLSGNIRPAKTPASTPPLSSQMASFTSAIATARFMPSGSPTAVPSGPRNLPTAASPPAPRSTTSGFTLATSTAPHTASIQPTAKKNGKRSLEGEVYAGPTPDGDNILFTCEAGTLTCLAKKDGKPQWTFRIEAPLRCTPTISGGRAMLAGCDSRLHLIDVTNGKEVDSVPIDGPTGSTPAMHNERVYFGTEGGTFFAINIPTAADKKPSIAWTVSGSRAQSTDSLGRCRHRQTRCLRLTKQGDLCPQSDNRPGNMEADHAQPSRKLARDRRQSGGRRDRCG